MPQQPQRVKPKPLVQTRSLCKQIKKAKLQTACQKTFIALKRPVLGIKSTYSPIDTGISSYEIDSEFLSSDHLALPNQTALGTDYTAWLRKNFAWLFNQQNSTNSRLGTAYVYGDAELGQHSLLGEYGNGDAKGKGRTEYIWLPTQGGNSIPVGMYRNGKFFAIHADHLGTPRLITDDDNTPVWQWAYSAFGDNKPTGVLKATHSLKQAITISPVQLRATTPIEMNLRMPGQYFDEESGLFYNYYRNYNSAQGRYTQSDPIGLEGGLNRFGYVEGNPLSFTDPLGLDATNWNNTSGGRSRLEFPTNGNWGGKCWSGGQYSCGGAPVGIAPSLDSGDACYQRHDTCYETCGSNKQCIRSCNKKLVDELNVLPNDPRQWPSPPRPGTESDSKSYRDAARRWFR